MVNLLKKENYIIYAIILFLGIIVYSSPFLRFPYDVFYHLSKIDQMDTRYDVPEGRILWHFFWAKIFELFNISTNEIFVRAKIIHVIQTMVSFFSLYYFSKVFIRNFFKEIDRYILEFLSLWSVICWFTIFGSFTMYFHTAWNTLYSVNYQITLPLFWLLLAITMVVLLENCSLKKKLFYILFIIILSRIILQIHSMEFMYYLMYLIVFSIIWVKLVYNLLRQHFYFFILICSIIVFIMIMYQPDDSKIYIYIKNLDFKGLYNEIIYLGNIVVNGEDKLNRSFASINELMYVSFFMLLILLIREIKKPTILIDRKILFFLIFTSLFVFIPLNEYLGGLFAVITRENVIHRLYFSSSVFIIIPISIYYFYKLYINKNDSSISIIKLNLIVFTIMLFTYAYSKNSINKYNLDHKELIYYHIGKGNYYKNIKSLKDSIFNENINFHLSNNDMELIGERIKYYESLNKTSKVNYYYARHDIAFILKYVYRKKAYLKRRRNMKTIYNKVYNKHKNKKKFVEKFNLVLFEMPLGFKEYKPFYY